VAPTVRALRLPVCTDRDDQKFLEIARDADAAILDHQGQGPAQAGAPTARENLFRIMTPDAWVKTEAPATVE
jgi:predicted nucleic acid-binding protein